MASGTRRSTDRARRTGSWRRWAVIVLAFNIALGMGFSVVGLRHQSDDRTRAEVPLTALDAAASAQDAALWQAIDDGAATPTAPVDSTAAGVVAAPPATGGVAGAR